MSKETDMIGIILSVESCRKCNLWKTRNNPVVGEGSINADILFIGEAPGHKEDVKGRPFIGRAGKILDELLNSIGLQRNEVYIGNILKCRPPKNRNPLKTEIEKCSKYLDKQIKIINPKIIVTLGNFAASYIFNKFNLEYDKISNAHGKTFHLNSHSKSVEIIPVYHPAAAIYNQRLKRILTKDFKEIKKVINQEHKFKNFKKL